MPATSSRTGLPLRILCADDTPQIAEIVQDVLRLEGHSVSPVCDGQEAYRAIVAAPKAFDVLITDHRMPQLSGLSLVAKLREIGFSGVIIVHSSVLSELDLAGYRALAVEHIVTKPAEFGRLIAIIREISKARA